MTSVMKLTKTSYKTILCAVNNSITTNITLHKCQKSNKGDITQKHITK